MLSNRTLITLVVRDNATNEAETITIIVPFARNQTDQLNAFVTNFCLQKNVALFIPADFTAWPNVSTSGEFQCEVCNQPCLQQTIDFENLSITEKFCSNFCRRSINTEPQQE